VTVEPDRPYVHFPSTHHSFAPVAIGQSRSPTQVYELYNGGAVPVHYQLDLSALSTIKQVFIYMYIYLWVAWWYSG